MKNNLLYKPENIVNYQEIQPSDAKIISTIIAENRQLLGKILQEKCFTWENLVQPLAEMDNRLSLAFSPISHLRSVMSNDEWRKAYEEALPVISEYESDMAQHQGIYKAFLSLQSSCDFYEYNASEQKLINDTILNFELGGVNLPQEQKEIYKKNNLRLSELATQFSNNVLDSSNAWEKIIPEENKYLLRGVPENVLSLLKNLAQQKEQTGYRLTLDVPVVFPILSHAEHADLRAEIHHAYSVRASELSNDGKFNNSEIIKEIMQLRQQQAQILSFPDYASMIVKRRMTGNPETVFKFLDDLLKQSKEIGIKEMQNLRDYAKEALNLAEVKASDVSFVAEKMRQEKFNYSAEALRPYFPIEKVLAGMFKLTKNLFAVDIVKNQQFTTWHDDVLVFDILQDDKVIAHFYFDLYARPQKRGGAWMDGAATRFLIGEKLQLPVAYLVCNFTPAVEGKSACLNHSELTTLLHEFGHGLHHMLTKVDVYAQAGINGVEWDAVEQPSQFLENFAFEWEVIQDFSAHVDTGEALPEAEFKKLLAAKNFNSAMAMLRQLEFALYDFTYHSGENYKREALDLYEEIRNKVAVTPYYDYARFPLQFNHIFAGGYSAGYYSYKWAEVLSADSFSAFEEEGILNPATGKRFLDEILSRGSSRSSMDSFIAFRGRQPSVEALLRHSGLK